MVIQPFAVCHKALVIHRQVFTCFLYSSSSTISNILGAWLDQYSEDFRKPPDYSCLKHLYTYIHQMFPGSDLQRRAHVLLGSFQRHKELDLVQGRFLQHHAHTPKHHPAHLHCLHLSRERGHNTFTFSWHLQSLTCDITSWQWV